MPFVDIYQNYIVIILYILFIAILVEVFFLNKIVITKYFNKIKKKTWVYLFIIFLIGFSTRMFVFPHFHLIYIDEPWNLEIAKNIAYKNQPVVCRHEFQTETYNFGGCFLTQKPPGWSFLVSILYKIFGLNADVAFYFSSLIGSLSIILIFAFSYLVFNNEKISLWASFLLSLSPIHILWANTAEAASLSLFFVFLTMIFFFIYIKSNERRILALTALLLAFSILIRFENIVLLLIFFLIYLKFLNISPKLKNFVNLYYPSIIFVAIIFFSIFEVLFINIFRPNFYYRAIDFYYLNFFTLLKDSSLNFIYLPLVVMSFFLKASNKENKEIYVALPMLFFFFLYLPIYSESRMALVLGAFIIILSAYSLEWLMQLNRKWALPIKILAFVAIIFALILSLIGAYKEIYIKYPRGLLETRSINEIKQLVGDECHLIAEYPSVVTSSSNIKGITTRDALNSQQLILNLARKGCVYYFFDGYCTEWTISPVRGSIRRCNNMLQGFNLEEKASFGSGKIKYVLYELVG